MEGKFYGMCMNHPDNKHDTWAEKNTVWENPTKRAGPIVQGILETQMEIGELEND